MAATGPQICPVCQVKIIPLPSGDRVEFSTGPAGTLTAGAMELTKRQDDTPGYLLVFKNGVRLLYEPQP